MTRLHLKLHQPNASGYIEAAAVASVRWLVDKSGLPVKKCWREERAVDVAGGDGHSGTYTVFELPGGGTYCLDVRRPRASNIYREYQIEDGAEVTDLLTLRESPHEWLGWQKFAGIVRAKPSESMMRSIEKAATRVNGAPPTRNLTMPINHPKMLLAVPTISRFDIPDTSEAWSLVSTTSRGDSPRAIVEQARARPLHWPDHRDDEFVTWFLQMPELGEVYELVNRLHDPQQPLSQLVAENFPRWIIVERQGQVDLVSLPWAWGNEHGEEIRLVYDRIRPNPIDRKVTGHVIVSVQDRRWFSLLEFFAAGRLATAEVVADSVFEHDSPMEALQGKVRRPLVAVAGGIVLLARSARVQAQDWDDWLQNLCNWFPGVPDGAILLGCRRLQRAQDSKGVLSAFEAVKLGWERGIPFFSATIQMLSVALAQMGCEFDEADKLRRNIAAVASRVDPNQTFTVIHL